MTVYKPSADSYSQDVDMTKMIGTWQVGGLSKKGLKTHETDRLQAFYYYSYLANIAQCDYVVLSGKRTNSGRDEAVIITTKCINSGKKLFEAGYQPRARKAYDHPSNLCKEDLRIPEPGEPHRYAHLPELVTEEPCKADPLETHEDELLALIDCITGEGNKAKAFRAIARYLIREAINIEEKGSEENG